MRSLLCVLCLLLLPVLGADSSPATHKRDLQRALAAGDRERLARSIAGLRKMGGKEAVTVLLDTAQKLQRLHEGLYWLFVDGIASFGDREALEAIGQFIVKRGKTIVAQNILFALQRNRLSTAAAALIPVIHEAPRQLAFVAIRQLAEIRVPEVVDALIARLKTADEKDTELRRRLAGSLTNITGQRFGSSAANWEAWWSANRNAPLKGAARRQGRTGTAIDELDATRRAQIIGLEQMPKRRIVVIKGKCVDWERFDHNFDHIEHLLEQMGLPHTVITKEEVNAGYRFDQTMVVCINCMMWREHCVCPKCKPGEYTGNRLRKCTGCNIHKLVTYDFKKPARDRLKAFVERGGYLFTEDWVMEELLQKIYPAYLGAGPKLQESDVKALPGRTATMHPYMEGVFRQDKKTVLASSHRGKGKTVAVKPEQNPRTYFTRSKHKWKIDLDSPAIEVRNKRTVTTLLYSPELERMAGGNGALAVTFKPGRRSGVVLHILSHFGKQTTLNSEYGIQNLLLNFLIDANLARGAAMAHRAEAK